MIIETSFQGGVHVWFDSDLFITFLYLRRLNYYPSSQIIFPL